MTKCKYGLVHTALSLPLLSLSLFLWSSACARVCVGGVTCISSLSGDVSLLLSLFLRGGWMEPH